MKILYQFLLSACLVNYATLFTTIEKTPQPWDHMTISETIRNNILNLPIAHPSVTSIEIEEQGDELVNLLELNNPRIISIEEVNKEITLTLPYARKGVYKCMLSMLEILPSHIGIAIAEGLRPLALQKKCFDNKLKELYATLNDIQEAYYETTKRVSPFIDNIPTHATGAAVDITLFEFLSDGFKHELDLGQFDVISVPNYQQETFSENVTEVQKVNRLILLNIDRQRNLLKGNRHENNQTGHLSTLQRKLLRSNWKSTTH